MLTCTSISLTLKDKESKKEMSSRFARFVFHNKKVKNLDTIKESIEDIVENHLFQGVGWDNVHKVVDESLRNRLLIECSQLGLIKKEHIPKKLQSESLF